MMHILAALLLVGPLVAQRPYYRVSVESLAVRGTPHTHILVTGRAVYTRMEPDTDRHIRLQGLVDTTKYVLAECIPKLPCRRPAIGEVVTVWGISRRDPEHGWWEVHPVERGP